MEPFKRNYWKEDAVCPKCGSGAPKPRYVPEDRRVYDSLLQSYYHDQIFTRRSGVTPSTDLIQPDRVDNLCRCGYQWSEKPAPLMEIK